jgi:hypothetical protein
MAGKATEKRGAASGGGGGRPILAASGCPGRAADSAGEREDSGGLGDRTGEEGGGRGDDTETVHLTLLATGSVLLPAATSVAASVATQCC